MSLDDQTIRDLIGFTDDRGVLSFYVGHTPSQAADPQPTAPIEIRNQLRQLTNDLEGTDRDLARAVESRVADIADDIAHLLDPKASGRGRALFVGVASGETATVSLPIPFRERVVLHDNAYVRPLVAAHDEGRAAGILVASRSGARVLRWAIGEVEQLATFEFELTDAQLAEVPSGATPATGPNSPGMGLVNRERFEDRIDDNHHRFLRDVGDKVMEYVAQEGWDRLVIAGSPKVRESARDALPASNGLRILTAEQSWEDSAPHEIAEQVWPLLRSVHQDREQELVRLAVERALGGQAGAVGLRQVCEALNEGRVSHLLYVHDLSIDGYVSEEGTLHPRVEGLVAESDLDLDREPLFVERMIEKAIGTSAQATPIEPDHADPLYEHEGVAALLRW